jgi:adenosylcobinamide-GDP ribazoletransferase
MMGRGMSAADELRKLTADIAAAVRFGTRLPLPGDAAHSGADVVRAAWAFPIAGALVGLIAAAVYACASLAGVPPLPAAGLAVAATLVATGCLHEDGLADVVDSFGADTRERKLEIMRDSRVGTYGACALVLSLLLRAAALAAIANPAHVAVVLVATHMAARAGLPLFMRLVPPARDDGLSAAAGTPSSTSAIAGVLLGVVAVVVGLGPAAGLCAIALVAAAFASLAWLCTRQIGGQTGDVLGTLEQSGEILILLVAAASVGW